MVKIVVIILAIAVTMPLSTLGKEVTLGSYTLMASSRASQQSDPLIKYLESKVATDISSQFPPDYRNLLARACRGEFDLMTLPPHLALYLEQNGPFLAVIENRYQGQSQLIIHSNSTIDSAMDLEGKTVAVHDELALNTLNAVAFFMGNGASKQRPPDWSYYRSQDRAILALIKGEVESAVISSWAVEQIKAPVRDNIMLLEDVGVVSGDVYVVNTLSPNFHVLKQALNDFLTSTSLKDYIELMDIEGVDRWNPEARKIYAPVVRELDSRLKKEQFVCSKSRK